MTAFSNKDRIIASILSSTPWLKKIIKSLYIRLNSLIYKKKYTEKIISSKVNKLVDINIEHETESFGGYYDSATLNEAGWLYTATTNYSTKKVPDPAHAIKLWAINIYSGERVFIDRTYSYTWQQGARAQWITSDLLIYNVFEDNIYFAKVYSLKKRSVIKNFTLPNQSSFKTQYFLSINYRRIMKLRADYGYRNLPSLTNQEMKLIDNDGIWKVDYNSGNVSLVHSLQSIISFRPKSEFKDSYHAVNHIMISPDGQRFIFIHRWYRGGKRYDRLIVSDFNSFTILVDEGMVSHMCWVDNTIVFGYFRHNKKDAFYYINIKSQQVTLCNEVSDLQMGDGHPSYKNNLIIFDTYPDKSRIQHLFMFNIKTHKIEPLLELWHSVKYSGQSRCDLHPRFSEDGKYITFDSVHKGYRTQCILTLKQD